MKIHSYYVPNQKVLKKKHMSQKLGHKISGPYKILQTHVNGTVTIELKPGTSERINVHRVIHFKE
jgi:hypothetical protein